MAAKGFGWICVKSEKGRTLPFLLSCSFADIMIQVRKMNSSSSPLLIFKDRIIPSPPTDHPGPWTARCALNQAAFRTWHWIWTCHITGNSIFPEKPLKGLDISGAVELLYPADAEVPAGVIDFKTEFPSVDKGKFFLNKRLKVSPFRISHIAQTVGGVGGNQLIGTGH